MAAGNVEHTHPRLKAQQPDDQRDVRVGALVGEHVPIEMEVVLAEDLVEVEARHGPV